ncbi:MAG: beta strand repeat-containing protein, partial [Phycisphaerales bacterium]
PGRSVVTTLALGGTVSNVSVFADELSAAVAADARLTKGGTNAPVVNLAPTADPDTDLGAGTPGTSFTGTGTFASGTLTYTFTLVGPGTGFFDATNNRLTLRGTTAATNLTIASTGSLTNFDLVTQDDSALGVLTVSSNVDGDSDFIIDGAVTTMSFKSVAGTGTIRVGGDVTTASFLGFSGGFFAGRNLTTLTITGDFGAAASTVAGEASIQLLQLGAVAITGANRALLSVSRDIASITMGSSNRADIRSGGSIGPVTTGALSQTVISSLDAIGVVVVNGSMSESTIAAGADLGSDGFFGGVGTAADTVTTGSIASVTISGDFTRSSITAGYTRGVDTYFGTVDDLIAPGRSVIGPVTITGTATGSSRFTESYRIASSGTVGAVRAGGVVFDGEGNLQIESPLLQPVGLRVTDIATSTTGRVFSAEVRFNQPIDYSSVSRALSVLEVRGTGQIQIRLIEGADFTITPNSANDSIILTFSQAITSANLPVIPGRPGPGMYRIEFERAFLRAKLVGTQLDGDGDGFSTPGDDFSQDTVIGDAGDKIQPQVITVTNSVGTRNIDLYTPINLDVLLDNNYSSDGLADANVDFKVRGFIGDHPDTDPSFFRFASDVDVYSITLRAGQILRLGGMEGTAALAIRNLHTSDGQVVARNASNAILSALPAQFLDPIDRTFDEAYLIKRTGTYYISVSNSANPAIARVGAPNDVQSAPGGVGAYLFTLEIFDDGDSGFNSDTDSGDGTAVVDPPAVSRFAGTDGAFGTIDDQTSITIGGFVFTLNRGADGIPNTADDVVSGDNGNGITVSATASGTISRTIESSIGPAGHAGGPGDIASDVDVYHLNNRAPIAPGTKMRATIRLADAGADLGSITPVVGLDRTVVNGDVDSRGAVQFALFDTSASSGFDDASMIFSPTDFSPRGGKPNTVIADNGSERYGFDSNGDFFIEFVVPAKLGSTTGEAGSFALYLQGVYNSDYSIQLDTIGAGTRTPVRQNVFIETQGGTVDWLEVAGRVTNLTGFDPATLGFRGSFADGTLVKDYILDSLLESLTSTYARAGLDVRFSYNPADFEFQPFSTVYLTSSMDPLSALLDTLDWSRVGFPFPGFTSVQPFGFSEHSDPFNIDLNDEAVVFTPTFSRLGLGPSQTEADLYVQSLTASLGRRVGELMGLRLTEDNNIAAQFTGNADIQAADSPGDRDVVETTWIISGENRLLSGLGDSIERTNFFLGRQNASSLLDQIIRGS